jgi:hypothetical protein
LTDAASSAEASSAWNALAYGLGQLLGGLADFDFATFAVDGRVVITVSRDSSDVWILASGPEDDIEPIELSPAQRDLLRKAGFAPPKGEAAERSAQRVNWWLREPMAPEETDFDTAGDRLVFVLRDVYGARSPAAIVWQGLALSDGARSVLDALPLTRSPYQPR